MELYVNAKFITCDSEDHIYSAMLVDNGRILWIGNAADVPMSYIDAGTGIGPQGRVKKADLGGAVVTPAFGDTHMHFQSLSMFENTFYLMDVRSFAEAEEIVRKYSAANPKKNVLLGYGACAHLVEEKRLPEKKDLDRWSDRPMFIVKYDGHAAVCNSAMMAKFSDTVLNDPGCDRETGWLYQNAFYAATNEATALISTLDIVRGLTKTCDYLASVGIGMVHNVEGVGFANDLDIDLMRFTSAGLPQTFRTFFQTMSVKTAKKHHMKRIGGCFKLALDGCFGSEDAALTAPYANDPENSGVLNYSQEEVNAFAIEANRAGMQIAMHCIGDAAVEQCIRAYEAAYEDHPWTDARHVMIHVCMASEEQLRRAAKLKLCIAAQSPFIYWAQEPDEYLASVLGRERTDALNPLGTMHRLGIMVGDGSDGPCTRPKPLRGMQCAVTHPNESERISRLQALHMITRNPAYISHDEKDRGSLEVGKIADFTVLSGDPLEVPENEIEKIEVKGLYLHGKKYRPGRTGLAGMLGKSILNRISKREFL